MATCLCFLDEEERIAARHSKRIDEKLDRERDQYKREIKILLLGAGESGKSTFLKQMRIIHGENYSPEERAEFRPIIYHNVLKGMKILIDSQRKLGIVLGEPSNEDFCDIIASHRSVHLDPAQFSQYVDPLQALWRDEGVQAVYERRNEFQLGDSTKYFMDKLHEIKRADYVPSIDDVLHSRKATKEIIEYKLRINRVNFRFVDVGGQRSQRQKWFRCFDDVTAILFLVGSSEFDQKLLEDRQTNRITESCNIFETIVNNDCFRRVAIILFFNKSDLLEEKIKHKSIKEYFPSFQGSPHKLDDVKAFLTDMFNSVRASHTSDLYHHFTTATDTNNIKFVFQAVHDTILIRHIQDLMLS